MPSDFVPEVIGKYARRELLGQGSSAVVYRAVNEDLDKVVALKVFKPNTTITRPQLEAHRQEAVFGARLDHPNIASVIDVIRLEADRDGTRGIAIVMEYVEGEHLDHLIERDGPVSLQRALEMTVALADAVSHAYACGVVHRGVKSSNIIVRLDGSPAIIDLGTAAARGAGPRVPGTGLRSAECFADIRGLGLVLLHCLTGAKPYPEDELLAVMSSQQPPGLSESAQDELRQYPLPIRDLLGSMLSDGFETPRQVREALHQARSILFDATQPIPTSPTRSGTPPTIGIFGPSSRYRDVDRLGEGTFGMIFKAYDTQLERVVAIKVLRPEFINSPEAVERFHREAAAGARLRHQNIIDVITIGRDSDTHYFAMEFVDGCDLGDMLDKPGGLPLAEAAGIVRQVADGLAVAHDANVVHRDMKPKNILIDHGGRAVITDFGIALVHADRRLTSTGSVIGTYHYMSPEQAMAKPVDSRTDIFSLGVVLYECLTGVVPFDADTPLEIMKRLTEDVPSPPSRTNSQVPAGLDDLVMEMLAKEPDHRTVTAREVSSRLAEFS